jgi:rare lipoprotein A (peptidoglycan hydrolase)
MRARVLLVAMAVVTLTLLPVGFRPAPAATPGTWSVSRATWYGPGLYGRRTSCGQALSSQLQGVAHRQLPCGTLVEFEWHGRRTVVPVIDRGPWSTTLEWDLTEATCRVLSHPDNSRCITSDIAWRL